jgi:hypothetical protein
VVLVVEGLVTVLVLPLVVLPMEVVVVGQVLQGELQEMVPVEVVEEEIQVLGGKVEEEVVPVVTAVHRGQERELQMILQVVRYRMLAVAVAVGIILPMEQVVEEVRLEAVAEVQMVGTVVLRQLILVVGVVAVEEVTAVPVGLVAQVK